MINYSVYKNNISNEWVTFVHGAGGSSSIWYKQIRDYKKHFNVLLLDLRGHGKSKYSIKNVFENKYTFSSISNDIIKVLKKEKIKSSHFVGISLGTILIRHIAEFYPKMVKSMILGGAVMKLNFRSQFLMKLGSAFKSIVPYIWIYKLLAFIIMPYKNHKESRILFINEAKKLYQKEFVRWFKLTSQVNPLLKLFRQVELSIPTLYVMGSEDYMFLESIKILSKEHKSSKLLVVPNCGHVVNVERPTFFNNSTIYFLNNLIKKK
ncbi:MAG: alpha/beta hydrolase [Flavobacteriaceae bacterium]|jgi:pimeloyl-ACP methyl ester carboxylesterase|nr:alpha/beta hydrolase [Flavobacteriaceae bacterium]MBT4246109.1 alpha/beta hydrolase [Flavobacteriaceae bacterium]MBT4415894.1 alpha/beta hydrolase [Flavobacteriaceae bacterium]MBT5596580.1 alpha/beta hydrolase [Flavobacteriaceae bacterium]MBT7554174.1 alpha/beta hydrolase [Flavobacteriaceae bacterium]